MPATERKNWAGNYAYRAPHLHAPRSVEEIQQLVKNCARVKALGAKHSFNAIADSAGDQISLEHFNEIELDPATSMVRVGGGVRYGELAALLAGAGYALHNLASLPHISVVGACATGTHGSGSQNGNLATAVHGIEMVTGNGEVVVLAGESCLGVVVGLGALGITTNITLRIQPRFDVRQVVYQDLPFEKLEEHLEEIFSSGYSVSLFTDWQQRNVTQVWVKRRSREASFEPEFFGAKMATQKLHPLAGFAADSCTDQGGVLGPWHERLPHFRMDHTPSSGDELQSEYFVPMERAYEAILAVEALRDSITPLLFVSELRTITSDELWMSPCYRRTSLAIHFTWKPEWAAVRKLLPVIEERLQPFDARPHWGKLFTMVPARTYKRLPDFLGLMNQYDPLGRFRNEYLMANLTLAGTP